MDETLVTLPPSGDEGRHKLIELEAIVHHATIGIVFTRNRQVTRCNPAFERMFGFLPDRLVGQPGRTIFISDEDYHLFSEHVRGQLLEGKPVEIDWAFRDSQQRPLICRIRAQAINPSPEDEGTVWLFEDITAARQHAEALQRSTMEFEAVMNNAPIAILFTVDRKITRGNADFCRMFGYPPEAVCTLTGRDLFPSDEVYAEIGKVAGSRLSKGESVTVEITMRKRDGTDFWAHIVAYVIDPANPRAGTIWLVTDRTDAKKQEEAMRLTLFENQAILDNAVVGIVYLKNRIVERCNPQAERIFGYEPGTLVGRNTREWYATEEEYLAVGVNVYPSIARGEQHVREQRLLRQNGELFWCRIAGRLADIDNPIEGGSIWVLEDTNERHAAEEALINATALMHGVFNNARVSIITTLPDGIIRLMNQTAEQWLGYAADELIGKSTPGIFHDTSEVIAYSEILTKQLGEPVTPGFATFVTRALVTGSDEREWTYIRKDGSRFPVHLTISVLRDYNGEISGYIGIAIDITDRRRADEAIRLAQFELEERVTRRTAELAEANRLLQLEVIERQQIEAAMRHMAHFDSLTGLPNRNLLQDRMNQALARARRHHSQVGLMFIDLDRFKTINDSLGHDIGDQLLTQVGLRMSYVLRETDTLARLGGDEFVLLIPELDAPERLASVAEKLIEVLGQPIPIDTHALHITPSIGICCYPQDGEDTETLMRNADTAMYSAKAGGRNNYRFFTGNMNLEADERFQLETALRYAINRNELSLVYQPLIDNTTGRLCGMETLLRWQTSSLGPVSPAKFIPIAEESGTIVPIGAWVLEHACRQARQWRDQGHTPLLLAINLSPLQFRQKDLLPMIRRILDETGYPADGLELEITESSLINDVDEAIDTLQRLTDMGIRLAIDDFGTGYSSLSYLKNFPVHKLKVDQSFVRDLQHDERSAGVVSTIIALAKSLKLEALAEGVETADQRAQLDAMGCRYMQGYLFSRPLPPDQFIAFVADRSNKSV